MSDLLSKLDILSSLVSKQIKYINSGGCCVFAAMVANQLKQCKNVSHICFKVADRYITGNELIKAKRKLRDNHTPLKERTLYNYNKYGVYFSHVVLEFMYDNLKYHYDSTGLTLDLDHVCFRDIHFYKGHLSLREGCRLANTPIGWNPTFDWNKNIPKIEKFINKVFCD